MVTIVNLKCFGKPCEGYLLKFKKRPWLGSFTRVNSVPAVKTQSSCGGWVLPTSWVWCFAMCGTFWYVSFESFLLFLFCALLTISAHYPFLPVWRPSQLRKCGNQWFDDTHCLCHIADKIDQTANHWTIFIPREFSRKFGKDVKQKVIDAITDVISSAYIKCIQPVGSKVWVNFLSQEHKDTLLCQGVSCGGLTLQIWEAEVNQTFVHIHHLPYEVPDDDLVSLLSYNGKVVEV